MSVMSGDDIPDELKPFRPHLSERFFEMRERVLDFIFTVVRPAQPLYEKQLRANQVNSFIAAAASPRPARHVTSRHVTSRHVTSRHVTSRDITPRPSRLTLSCPVSSSRVSTARPGLDCMPRESGCRSHLLASLRILAQSGGGARPLISRALARPHAHAYALPLALRLLCFFSFPAALPSRRHDLSMEAAARKAGLHRLQAAEPAVLEELRDAAKQRGLYNFFLPAVCGLTVLEYAPIAEILGIFRLANQARFIFLFVCLRLIPAAIAMLTTKASLSGVIGGNEWQHAG